MTGMLETLLMRIRDGGATDADLQKARGLVRHDARLPPELREEVLILATEAPSDAAGLLAVLGVDELFGDALRDAVSYDLSVSEAELTPSEVLELEDDWPWGPLVAEAVSGEAGRCEVVDAVLARVDRGVSSDWVYGPLLAEAVSREGGRAEVALDIQAAVGAEKAGVVEAILAEAGPVPSVDETLQLAWLADAVQHEAGTVDVSHGVFAALEMEALPVAEAVRREAGLVDVAAVVISALELADGVMAVAEAVRQEAGPVDVGGAVLAELQISALPVAEAVRFEAGELESVEAAGESGAVAAAVRSEAGSVDVTDSVLSALAARRASTSEPPGQMPSAEAAPMSLPAPANRAWSWGAMLMAAIVLCVVGASQLIGGLGPIESAQPAPMQFAAASEIVVDELEWSDAVQVMQTEGDEGALIIWVDEEAT